LEGSNQIFRTQDSGESAFVREVRAVAKRAAWLSAKSMSIGHQKWGERESGEKRKARKDRARGGIHRQCE
jgi:hypothetical protein